MVNMYHYKLSHIHHVSRMKLRIKERISYIAKHPGHKKLRPNNMMLQKVENLYEGKFNQG